MASFLLDGSVPVAVSGVRSLAGLAALGHEGLIGYFISDWPVRDAAAFIRSGNVPGSALFATRHRVGL